MFAPMAWAFIFALLGALAIALFLSPVLAYYLLPERPPERRGSNTHRRRIRPARFYALRMRWIVVATAIALVALAAAVSVRPAASSSPAQRRRRRRQCHPPGRRLRGELRKLQYAHRAHPTRRIPR